MAQFDVFRGPDGADDYWLDCQSDLIDNFDSRIVVPLVPCDELRRPIPRLHPVFEIGGTKLVMATQQASAVDRRVLGERVATLANHRDQIIAAFDVLLTGV